jgi:acetyltransferase
MISFDNLFNPRSVAVIGASADKTKVGYALLANLYQQGATYKNQNRKIFPVNLTEKQILGLPTYASVKDILESVDLAVIAVRADVVPQVLIDCGAKKIPAVIVISAGFREVGEEGKKREEELAQIARENNITLLGPNCLGVINAPVNFNASFAVGMPPAGEIAILSQSGALGTALIDLAIGQGIGFSKFISLGNEAALSEIEFLEYLAKDSDTKAIMVYLEKLSDGPKFMELAARITKTKPLVVLRAGRSQRGQVAAMSHTGSLAPADAVFTAACRQTGVITVDSIREFFNLAKLFQLGIRAPLQKLVVLTNGGGPSVVTTDLIDFSRSLTLVELASETQNALRAVLPPMAAFGNPVDIIGDALATRYEAALKIVTEVPEAEAIILMVTPQMMTEIEATAKLVTQYCHTKPIIPVFLGGPITAPALNYFKQNKLANFNFPKDAIEALDALARGVAKSVSNPGGEALESLKTPPLEPTRMMNFFEMNPLLVRYGIKLSGVFVSDKSHLSLVVNGLLAPRSLGEVGGGLAIKAFSPDIVHKTDSAAVKLNLTAVAEVEAAWEEMKTKNPLANIEGILVQPMVKGKELIIGMKRDPIFGATILFGLGGIFTEALKDTALRIAPLAKEDALQMIGELKAKNILLGRRGEPPVNLEALADLLVKISTLAIEHPEIKEIDFNPVMATPEEAIVIDARLMV